MWSSWIQSSWKSRSYGSFWWLGGGECHQLCWCCPSPGSDRRKWNIYGHFCCAAWQGRMVLKAQGSALESSGNGDQCTLSRLQWLSSPFRLYTVCEPNAELFWCNQKYRVTNLSKLIAIWRVDKVRPSILVYTDSSDCQENTVWLTERKLYFSHRESVVW